MYKINVDHSREISQLDYLSTEFPGYPFSVFSSPGLSMKKSKRPHPDIHYTSSQVDIFLNALIEMSCLVRDCTGDYTTRQVGPLPLFQHIGAI